MYTMIMMIR